MILFITVFCSWNWDTAAKVGTFVAPIVALILAIFHDDLKRKQPVALLASRPITNIQRYPSKGKALKIYRLPLYNASKTPIKNARAHLSEVFEKRGDNLLKRENFIDIPLAWTNGDRERDIAPGETALLDIVQMQLDFDSQFEFCWPKSLGMPEEPDFRELTLLDRYILPLKVYHDGGPILQQNLIFNKDDKVGLFLEDDASDE